MAQWGGLRACVCVPRYTDDDPPTNVFVDVVRMNVRVTRERHGNARARERSWNGREPWNENR